jgi:hypothetical protein
MYFNPRIKNVRRRKYISDSLESNKGKWHLLQMVPHSGAGHVTGIMMDQYGKIWFKDHIDSKPTPTLHGPNKLKTCWKNFNPHHQKGDGDVSGQTMKSTMLFCYSKDHLNKKYYEHKPKKV